MELKERRPVATFYSRIQQTVVPSVINLLYIYINQDKEIYNIKSEFEKIENACLTKERILYLIKQHQYNLEDKHRLIDLLKFNIDIDPMETHEFITDDFTNNKKYLVSLKIIDDIKFNDTIEMIKAQNSVIFILTNAPKNANANTRRIHIRSRNKNNVSKKKNSSSEVKKLAE